MFMNLKKQRSLLTAALLSGFLASHAAQAQDASQGCLNFEVVFNKIKAAKQALSVTTDVQGLDAASIPPIIRAQKLKTLLASQGDLQSALKQDTYKQDGCKSLSLTHKASENDDIDYILVFAIDQSLSNDKKLVLKFNAQSYKPLNSGDDKQDQASSTNYWDPLDDSTTTFELVGDQKILITDSYNIHEYVRDPVTQESCNGIMAQGPIQETNITAWGDKAPEAIQQTQHFQEMLAKTINELLEGKGRCAQKKDENEDKAPQRQMDENGIEVPLKPQS